MKVDPDHPPGRFAGPLADTGVRAPLLRLKRWHYMALDAGPHFVVLGLVHLGYVAQVFAYLVDRERGERSGWERLLPPLVGPRMATAPVDDSSEFRRGPQQVWLGGNRAAGSAVLALQLGERRLRGSLRFPLDAGISLRHELDVGRRAYTFKLADAPAEGALWLDDAPLALQDARVTVDWTRSHALRHTRWRWASATGKLRDGRRVGLNLSQHVYDVDGVSRENTLWLDGAPRPVGRVLLEPTADDGNAWTLRSDDGRTALSFQADGARRDDENFGLVRTRFVQASGHFRGTLDGAEVEALYGVMEDHDAHW